MEIHEHEASAVKETFVDRGKNFLFRKCCNQRMRMYYKHQEISCMQCGIILKTYNVPYAVCLICGGAQKMLATDINNCDSYD